jgi:hypothetical protein
MKAGPGSRRELKKIAHKAIFFGHRPAVRWLTGRKEGADMSKPPKTPPHSDLNGVHEDELRNTEVASQLGEDTGDLARAKKESIGRPEYVKKPRS